MRLREGASLGNLGEGRSAWEKLGHLTSRRVGPMSFCCLQQQKGIAMQDSEEDRHIAERLRVPPKRTNGRSTATALVRKYYGEIHAAWMKDRQAGKTWAEIGRDLRPHDPIAGDTVGRAFARITAERTRVAQTASKSPPVGTSPNGASTVTSTADENGNRQNKRQNPFAPSIDPIRADDFEENRHA